MVRLLAIIPLLALPAAASAQMPECTRTEDVIYGRKWGMCLTLDAFVPKAKPNGLGVVFCVSDKLTDLKVHHLLVVRKGEDHTPKDWGKEMGLVADWFEKHTSK